MIFFKKYHKSFSFIRALRNSSKSKGKEEITKLAPSIRDEIAEFSDMMLVDPSKLAQKRQESGGVFYPTTEEDRREAYVRVFGDLIYVSHHHHQFGGAGFHNIITQCALSSILQPMSKRSKRIAAHIAFMKALSVYGRLV